MADIKVYLCEVPGCGAYYDTQAKLWGHKGRMHTERKNQPLKLADHGTPAGARTHRRRGEKPCPACRIAWAIYQRQFKAKHGQ